MIGSASSIFEYDNFYNCSAFIGGSIYATDFVDMTVVGCKFDENFVTSGKGENIYAHRYVGKMEINRTTFVSFMNSVSFCFY